MRSPPVSRLLGLWLLSVPLLSTTVIGCWIRQSARYFPFSFTYYIPNSALTFFLSDCPAHYYWRWHDQKRWPSCHCCASTEAQVCFPGGGNAFVGSPSFWSLSAPWSWCGNLVSCCRGWIRCAFIPHLVCHCPIRQGRGWREVAEGAVGTNSGGSFFSWQWCCSAVESCRKEFGRKCWLWGLSPCGLNLYIVV